MTVYRCILPEWASLEYPERKKVVEGQFTHDELISLNDQFYNIYFLPNYPSLYEGGTVEGFHIDNFNYCFVDMDLKENVYASKDAFLKEVNQFPLAPTRIVDSGNGIHVYWQVTDLDAKSYLSLQRRLMRALKTDEAVCKIYQLMRVPGTINTKNPDDLKVCEILQETGKSYTCEQLSEVLPPISFADEQYCKQHFERTYKINNTNLQVVEKLPLKFAKLLDSNNEVKDIWAGKTDDRSKADYRLGHIMFASGFTKDEATSVLVNSAKALERTPSHRLNYAANIIDKIWTFEIAEDKASLMLSSSVKDILNKNSDNIKGTRFPCWSYLDNTHHGFRLGQVIGLIAGSGVGKTAVALNMFRGFVESNPDYVHFFIPLEQPANEIADRWRTICGNDEKNHEKVHVLSNYDEDGNFRNLSFDEIKDYLLKFQQVTGHKVGCVVIDHIGALKKKNKKGENQDLMDICHAMKAFAVQTNTLLVMQSQAPREKAGIGDLELDKNAAYGTVYFESYCDYLITLWQPLKRVYNRGAPTTTAFKFCKIRHKNQKLDTIQEDVCYNLMFDPDSQRLRELNQSEQKSFDFFINEAVNLRKKDKKTDVAEYVSVKWRENDTLTTLAKKDSSNRDRHGGSPFQTGS